MALIGYTGEVSLYRSSRQYRPGVQSESGEGSASTLVGDVTPAQNNGDGDGYPAPVKVLAKLATAMPDETPQVTSDWFDCAVGKVRFNSAKGRVKARSLKPGAPRYSDNMDPGNPFGMCKSVGVSAGARASVPWYRIEGGLLQ